jgi:hypothetical protein
MKDTHRDMTSIMNGNAKTIKELEVDEYNEIVDNKESYSFSKGEESVEVV